MSADIASVKNDKNCCDGSWIDCKGHIVLFPHGFFRHVPECKHHKPNDGSDICPMCWYKLQMRNQLLYGGSQSGSVMTAAVRSHKGVHTPEKDSL